jgi:nucleoside-diphosphate-sugar epimerase
MARTRGTATTPVVLRFGVVYGRGLLLIEAARRLARRGLLCVWTEPTMLQLIAAPDCVRAAEAAIVGAGVQGIYHVGDEAPITIQGFLDGACEVWGFRRPRRVPMWAVSGSAAVCEEVAFLFGTYSPVTRDLIKLGRVSHWGDTRRARLELIRELFHPTFASGRSIL